MTKNAVDLAGCKKNSVLQVDHIRCVAYALNVLHQESCEN